MLKTKKIRDMSFEEWFGFNEDRLRDEYEFDIDETLRLARFKDPEYLNTIESFDQYTKGRFEMEKDDEEYDEKHYG